MAAMAATVAVNGLEILLKFAKLLERNARELAVMESLDAGKTIYDCETVDVPETIHVLKWHAELIDKIYDQVAPASDNHIAMIVREPVGVVGLVLPWNFPFFLIARTDAIAVEGYGAALDRAGLLSDITRALSEAGVNILEARVHTSRDRVAVSNFTFEMGDATHLDHVIRSVRRVDAVFDAYRVTGRRSPSRIGTGAGRAD